ncbi:MAG TPA: cation transporter [Ignavibacteriales bacterium]|nr:cation transporter [Ignavibacteriales bacterium]
MQKKYYKYALYLSIITILYNLVEGLVSIYFGFEDETLSLFGFGVDSFIEVISGVGIFQMVLRIGRNEEKRTEFEKTALKITGTAFYILTFGLIFMSLYNIYIQHKPDTTFWGIIISIVSIIFMWALVKAKRYVGNKLNSKPILADANCTLVCIYISIVLLISSVLYELFGIYYIDAVGALGLTYFSFKEGKECFYKSKSSVDCCCECENKYSNKYLNR